MKDLPNHMRLCLNLSRLRSDRSRLPHPVRPRLLILLISLSLLMVSCRAAVPAEQSNAGTASGAETTAPDSVSTQAGRMDLQYANQFTVDYYGDGSALITIGGTDRFLAVPKDQALPAAAESGGGSDAVSGETAVIDGQTVPVIRTPVSNIYVAASQSMDLFRCLDALDAVRLTSTNKQSWTLPEVAAAMEDKRLLYAGKYSAPDFELLLLENCELAVENTMIYHSPEIKEQIESLGIPVLVERTSYESHPLGRVEWIRLYGLLLGQEEAAAQFFDRQVQQVESLILPENTDQTVAFFHINAAGAAVVRKPGDYITRMIELAGGSYIFPDLESSENALSTMNMQMETFYAGARDADVLIYNSTIDGELDSLEQLFEKSALFRDFIAVQTGNVWCTNLSMFQQSSASADIISDLNAILSGSADDLDQLTFLHRLR